MAVCFIDGEFTLKYISFSDPEKVGEGKSVNAPKPGVSYRILQQVSEMWLLPANKSYKPIHVTESNDFTVWGVVTYIIKKVHNRQKHV